MAPASVTGSHSSALGKAPLTWRPTKIMNVRDLSKDDDFLSHLLVEKLGTGGVPLYVHKMDPSRRLPKVDAGDLLRIVRRSVESRAGPQIAVRQAVDGLLALPPVRYYLRPYTQKQINAFATHASRYFELYNPNGSIEIAHTSRYSHMTGKSELCILATRPLTPGMVIAELKGSMAHLSKEEDRELKRTDLRNSDIRRDFSVIHSRQMKKNHLFLGPARFVNHDCENNCELFREGKYITFRVVRPVAVGEEITAHYGDGYFGKRNRYCLCETCEKNGRGGYTPENNNSGSNSDVGGSEDDFSDSEPTPAAVGNVNERRTRRGVYAIVQERDDDSDESEDEEKETNRPLANVPDMGDVDLELGGHPSSSRGPLSRRSASTSVPPSRTSEVLSSTTETLKSQIFTRSRKHSVSATVTPSISVKSLTPLPSVPHVSRGSHEGSIRLSTPFGGRGKEKDKVPIKEDPEARVLRTRLSLHAEKSESLSTGKGTVPLGSDGRPLPTCVTCFNILPVISVNNKVVWGLSVDTSSRRGRKRKEPQECPRCMRHCAIYGQTWPARLPNQVVNHSGRDDAETLRRSGQKTSSAAERKRPTGEEQPQKKSKADQIAVVELSSKAKEMLMPPKRKRGRPRKYPPPEEEPPKRKRGRPRIHSPCRSRSMAAAKSTVTGPRPSSPASVRSKSDQSSSSESSHLGPKSSVVQEQPRDPSGRFGKKAATDGRSMREPTPPPSNLARPQRMLPRTKVKQWLENNRDHVEMAVQTNGKRTMPAEVDVSPRPTKRLRSSRACALDGDDDPIPVSVLGSMSFRFSGVNGSLLCRPNPTNFARRKWAPEFSGENSIHEDDDVKSSLRTSESDSNGPVTPEDRTSLPILGPIPCAEAHPIQLPNASPRRSTRGAHAESITSVLIYNPSPVNFARRRWHSTTKSPLETGSGTRRSQRLRPRTSCVEDDVQSQPMGLLNTRSTVATRSVSPGKNPKSGGEPPAAPEADPDNFSISATRHGTGLNGDQSSVSTNSESDRAVGGLLVEGLTTHTPSAPASEDILSHLRVTYTSELPAVVPWKNAQATPMSHYLKKSASFHGDDFSSPTHLVHAGWDDSVSDVLSD